MKELLFDTNAVLYYLTDNTIFSINAEFIISFITEIELLSYPFISEHEKNIIKKFLNSISIIDINQEIKEKTINFRKDYKLKIPDAIICATSNFLNIPLITDDRQLFKVKECSIITFKDFKHKFTETKFT